METKWLMDNGKNENDDDSNLVSIPMVQIHGSGHHRASRQSHERSGRNSAGYSPLQDDEVFFLIDESAWSPEPRPLSTLNSVTADRHDNVDYFHVDENAWTMSGAYSETQEPVEAVTGHDGKVLFSLRRHKSMSPRPKRPRSLNLRSFSSASKAHTPASLSTQSSQMSLESNVNFGFQDFDDGSSLVNHRLVKFEHDTAMLFRSLSRPQQKSKKPWHRLISVWWNSFLGLCCSCCSCRRGCRSVVPIMYSFVPIMNSDVPIMYSVVPIIYSVVPIMYSVVPIMYSVVPIIYSVVPIMYSAVPIMNSVVPIMYSAVPIMNSVVPIIYSVVPIMCSDVPIMNSVET
ncbi:hypothetical protein Btru_034992 [Bulinus truncatus]|nr:hypothetical protein Btru_034992 [Bulinus truncatus]